MLEISHGLTRSGHTNDIQVSDRLGNVNRKLTLSDGSVFATKDNAAVDELFKVRIKKNSLVHAIESNLAWVLVALLLSVTTAFSFFKWGIPWAGEVIAHALPEKTNELIGANTLEFLDDYIFDPSQLEETQKQAIRNHFLNVVVPLDKKNPTQTYALHFRAWGEGESSVANALALPSGDIILTDKFVELSKNQAEIDSVLLHEMGHVVHRHTLETIAQSTLMTTAIMLATGDASGAADMGIGLGSLLLSASYSRGNEAEADQYAFEHMLRAKIDPTSFADIMDRITNYTFDEETSEQDPLPSDKDSATNQQDKRKSFMDYLSTHPNTAERIAQAKRFAQCYRNGLVVCDFLKVE